MTREHTALVALDHWRMPATVQVLIRGFIAINEKHDSEPTLEQQNSRTHPKVTPGHQDAAASHVVPVEKSTGKQETDPETEAVPEDAAAARDHSPPGDSGSSSSGSGGDGSSDDKGVKDASNGARTDARFELANELQTGSVDNQAEILSPTAQKAAAEGTLASKDARSVSLVSL